MNTGNFVLDEIYIGRNEPFSSLPPTDHRPYWISSTNAPSSTCLRAIVRRLLVVLFFTHFKGTLRLPATLQRLTNTHKMIFLELIGTAQAQRESSPFRINRYMRFLFNNLYVAPVMNSSVAPQQPLMIFTSPSSMNETIWWHHDFRCFIIFSHRVWKACIWMNAYIIRYEVANRAFK